MEALGKARTKGVFCSRVLEEGVKPRLREGCSRVP